MDHGGKGHTDESERQIWQEPRSPVPTGGLTEVLHHPSLTTRGRPQSSTAGPPSHSVPPEQNSGKQIEGYILASTVNFS